MLVGMAKRMAVRPRQLRRDATRSEELLWGALRGRALLGAKWRRQQVLGRFVADFFCAELKAVIEVDGAIHRDQAEADQERQRALEASGLRVLRVRASDVEMDLHGVLDRLAESLRASPSPILGEGDSGDAQDAAGVRARGRTVKGPGGPGGQVR